ncbi:MAG: putative metalloprotease CJM1_0395 family protein [Ferrovibrio sp.]
MVGSLSLFSPGSIQGYGAYSSAAGQASAGGRASSCSSLECSDHGALNRAKLQAQFPGLTLIGGSESGDQSQQTGFAPRLQAGSSGGGGNTGGRSATGGGRLAGNTLLTAQEQGQLSGGEAKETGELSDDEQAQVAKLKQIDAKVRAHERAHAAVGGAHAGAPSYSYTRGPDGQLYATGGEVAIDISAEQDPEATLQKATQIAAAALAPADPSGQDRAVAAAAAQLRLQALAQIREEKRTEQEQQEAERSQAKAEDAERQQQSGVAADPAAAPAHGQTGEAGDTQGISGQAASGSGSGQPAGSPGGNPEAAQARIAAANRQLGRLVGLTV